MSPLYRRRLRAIEEASMTALCRIEQKDPVTLDTGTLTMRDTNPDDDLVYAGPCKVRSNSSAVTPNDAGGQLLTEQQLVLAIPAGAVLARPVRVRALVTITAAEPPELVGRTFRIVGIPATTGATARRFPVEQTSTEDE